MDTKEFKEKLRRSSPILHPELQNMNVGRFVDTNSKHAVDRELTLLIGSEGNNGKYFSPADSKWYSAYIPSLEEKILSVEKDFKAFASKAVREGRRKPSKMPPELKTKYDDLHCRLSVAREERQFLEDKLKQLAKRNPENFSGLPPIRHRRHWSSGKFQGGILINIAGIQVAMNEDNTLVIKDVRSPYNGMPVPKFRAEVVKPMKWEYSLRMRRETKAAKKEGRPVRRPKYPQPGRWNKKTDSIEYQEYDNRTIQRIKAQK